MYTYEKLDVYKVGSKVLNDYKPNTNKYSFKDYIDLIRFQAEKDFTAMAKDVIMIMIEMREFGLLK